jgi:hypothetical protein
MHKTTRGLQTMNDLIAKEKVFLLPPGYRAKLRRV